MLREIINRSEIQDPQYQQELQYFPVISKSQHQEDAFYILKLNLTQSKLPRETSATFTEFNLRNFAFYDEKTNLLVLDFSVLPIDRDDKINFIAVIGCQINHPKFGIIDVSQQPLIIINGVQYFLLRSQDCNPDALRILYPLCQFIYVNERLLNDLEQVLSTTFDVSQTWQIKNALHVISKSVYDNESLVKTSAQSKQLNSFSGLTFSKEQENKRYSRIQTYTLQKYFSEILSISHKFVELNDLYSLRQGVQKNHSLQNSRWFILEGLKQSCDRLFVGQKNSMLKEFYKINNQKILQQLKQKVVQNYKVYSFQAARNGNKKKSQLDDHHLSDKPENEVYADIMKQKQREKQKLKNIKRNILQPFFEAETLWLGRTEVFEQNFVQIKKIIQQRYEKLLITLNESEEKYIINEVIQNQNGLEVFGNSKFDLVHVRFGEFKERVNKSLLEIIKNNMSSKQWKLKQRSNTNKMDIVASLDARIQINESKKQGLEQAIKLAQREYQYLNQQMYPTKNKRQPLEITK